MSMRKYKLDAYFTVRKYQNGGTLTIFIVGAWMWPSAMYVPLLRKLRKLHVNCVLFIPSPKIVAVGTPYSVIVTSSKNVVTEIEKLIVGKFAEDSRVRFAMLGISLGTTVALRAAKECPEIKRVALIAAHGDFSQHVPLWHDGKLVNKLLRFKKIVKMQPTSIVGSGKILNSINRTRDLSPLVDKEIYMSYGSKDTVMHAEVTKAFAEKLRKSNVSITIHALKGGHHRTIVRDTLLQSNVLSFLLEA